jgi:PhnB protein
MTETPKPIPGNSSILIPRLVCRDLKSETEFLTQALGVNELGHRDGPDGTPVHALLTVGPQMLMLEKEWPQLTGRAPQPDGSSPVVLYLYVESVDRTLEKALALGARQLIPATNQFWGDRTAWIIDPAGHVWTIATRIEETTSDERANRWDTIRSSSSSDS